MTSRDVMEFEERYGQIPKQSFEALRTGWSTRGSPYFLDAEGQKHSPGWGLEALKYLVEQRDVAAIGHETSDTDPAAVSAGAGYICEKYILGQDRYQVERMTNLDLAPPVGSIIFCGFPRGKGITGFTARCIAACPDG